MQIALIADSFPPMRSSAAVQLRDLSIELCRQGHKLVVIIPSFEQIQPWALESFHGVQVLRLKSPRTKGLNYTYRAISEFLMPFAMLRNLRKSPFGSQLWDGVVWYALR